jgi:hypothetical protein
MCDIRLPQAALAYRRTNNLLTPESLQRINVTAWLYETVNGGENIRVNPNIPITDLIKQIGHPAATPDAEAGLHSEGIAAEWFRLQRDVKRVLQIFTERIPCGAGSPGRGKMNCEALLATYYKGVPVYYYHSWMSGNDVAKTLRIAYELP